MQNASKSTQEYLKKVEKKRAAMGLIQEAETAAQNRMLLSDTEPKASNKTTRMDTA